MNRIRLGNRQIACLTQLYRSPYYIWNGGWGWGTPSSTHSIFASLAGHGLVVPARLLDGFGYPTTYRMTVSGVEYCEQHLGLVAREA